jgi:hypothetical protein
MGGSPSRSRDGIGPLLIRLGLVASSLGLLWLAAVQLERAFAAYAASFRYTLGPYVLVALAATTAGVAFGLSLTWPSRWGGYRWDRAVAVGIAPLVLVVCYLVVFGVGFNALPGAVTLVLARFGQAGLLISPLLLGLAIAAGFGEPRRIRSDRGRDISPELRSPGAQL